MLERATKANQRKARRAANCRRVAEHRQRVEGGQACYTVIVDGAVIDLLIRCHWLAEAEATDKKAVEASLSRMLIDAAKNR